MPQKSRQQNVIDINKVLLSNLNKREQDIISRRFGLSESKKQTLEEIGRDHNLTRERIRQLEAAALKKIKDLEVLKTIISELNENINSILKEYGGLVELNYLLDHLILLANNPAIEKNIYKNNYYFIISKLLNNNFNEIVNSKHLKKSLKHKELEIDHIEVILKELTKNIHSNNTVLTIQELLEVIKSQDSYKKHESILMSKDEIDLTNILKELVQDNVAIVNMHKPLYSILVAAQNIEQNKLGYWGINNWSEIKPKTINEKIYLILKENKKPMHFTQIAEEINKIRFDNKKANAATVHNELILGEKYVLVGRGMYTLTEWGYKKGTVTEIISDIIKSSNKTLSRDEIINEVLKQRLVKRTTVILALTNNQKFLKEGDGYGLLEQQ